MLKIDYGEIHCVKCIVCSTMKGKDVILGPKFDTLEKHAKKTKAIWNMPHLGKKQGELYVNKKCSHVKNEWPIYNKIISQLLNMWFKEVWRGEKKKKATICHSFAYATTWQTYVKVWSYEIVIFFSKCSYEPRESLEWLYWLGNGQMSTQASD
jgi:hypothetical protein